MQIFREKAHKMVTSIENNEKLIQKGNFQKEQIDEIKKICVHNKGDINMIKQKLKQKFGGEWFVLIYVKTSLLKKEEDFDFNFTNNSKENVFIFSENKYKYYICKL